MSSLKDLARDLKLSITTVSRALDDKADVSPATKSKVREAALRRNYQPNAAARSLRKQKADAVAVVLPAAASHIGLGALLNMLFEAGRHLSSQGLDLMIFTPPTGEAELQTLHRIVEGRRADALILVRTLRRDPRVAFLSERGVPFVTHGRTEASVAHAAIDGDGAAGFAAATRTLLDLGHRRIAHLAAPQEFNFAHLRARGWHDTMAAAGVACDGLMIEAAPNEAAGHAAAREMLGSRQPPTALLCATDAMAIGALSAVKQAGLVPGRDISIIGHDGLPSGLYTDPPLSTMEIAADDVGRRLAGMLIKRIGGADPRDLQDVLPIRQVPRATHRKAAAAAKTQIG